jgi:pimeloyl-ACP methyl ester carboxylesterase
VAAALERNPPLRAKIDLSSIVLFNTSGGMTGFRYEYVPFWARPLMAFVRHVVLGPVLGGYFFRNFRTRENVERILKESGVYGDVTNVDDELLELLLAPADDAGAEQVFLAVFAGPAGPTAESFLPSVTVPVLALWGERDPWTPLNAGMHPGTGLQQHHGTGDFVLDAIPGAGHCPHDECPALVNDKMIAFLSRVAAASSSPRGKV